MSEKSAAERQAPLQATRKLPIAEVGLLIFEVTKQPARITSKIINKKSSILNECSHLPSNSKCFQAPTVTDRRYKFSSRCSGAL
jgi:hypothetical protein